MPFKIGMALPSRSQASSFGNIVFTFKLLPQVAVLSGQ
jgi:hypothetical protein